MITAALFQPISVRDYLSGERQAKHKHEYVEGIVYLMAGATNTHNRIATNATGSLYSQLRGHRCQVFNSDAKVRVQLSRGTRFYYPDTMVVCQPNSPDDTFHDSPVVIIEVISAATRRFDEHEKREAYLTIQSLCVYILVEQNSAGALVYRRGDSGFDREVYLGLDAIIPLPEIACNSVLAELYENVDFSTPDQIREQEDGYEN